MSLNRKFGACLITFILLISSFSFLAIVSPKVNAEEDIGGTPTLYFTAFNLTDAEYGIYPEMSSNIPDGTNDLVFPPNIKNTEEWSMWFESWILSKMSGLEEQSQINEELRVYREELENLSKEELEAVGIYSLEDINRSVEEYRENLTGIGEDLLFNPFIMHETYSYTGEKLHVNGSVTFDLYFSSNLQTRLLYSDEVQVAISVTDGETFEEVYNTNTNATIEPKLFGGKIQEQTISIDDVDFDLKNGDQIVFSIEMKPTERPIGNFIENQDEDRILELADMMADVLINHSSSEKLKEVGNMTKELVNETRSGTITLSLDDLAELANAVRSSSFVYNSADHHSSVTLPSKLPGEEKTSSTYYLSANNTLTEEVPTSQKVTRANLKNPTEWTGDTGFSRNKILTGASASLYIQQRDLIRLLNLGKTDVDLTLSFGNQTINASAELKKTTILSILRPVKTTDIEFVFDPIEISYGEKLSLKISSDAKFHLLGFRRMARVLYDSVNYQSSITLKFKDTDNINMSVDSPDQKIPAAGSAEYILNITSKYADTVTLNVLINDKQGDWNLDYHTSVDVSPGYTLVHIFANYTGETYDNYDYIQMTVEATGTTGIARQDVSAEVSKDAVKYGVDVEVPTGKEIKHGTSDIYTFTIKNINTGLISDTYSIEATSEHGWNVEVNYEHTEVQAGDDFNVDVTVFVPEFTDISSDVLTLTITSTKSEKVVEVTTTVILPSILENFYNFFESPAKDIGLDSVLGDYAGAFLIFIIVFIIIIFLVIIIYLLRIKYVELICLERIKEIEPEGKAEFNISIHNPYKNKLWYKISAEMDPKSEGWEASVDTGDMALESKESRPLKLTVKPNDYVTKDGWVEVKVVAENIEKGKVAKISTVTSLKHAEPELRISGVFHWPTAFKKGDKVVTSLRIHNDGKASASNVTIALFVNGEEKNKAENITIPRGGYAEIEMPWIAVKGKNEVNIVVK